MAATKKKTKARAKSKLKKKGYNTGDPVQNPLYMQSKPAQPVPVTGPQVNLPDTGDYNEGTFDPNTVGTNESSMGIGDMAQLAGYAGTIQTASKEVEKMSEDEHGFKKDHAAAVTSYAANPLQNIGSKDEVTGETKSMKEQLLPVLGLATGIGGIYKWAADEDMDKKDAYFRNQASDETMLTAMQRDKANSFAEGGNIGSTAAMKLLDSKKKESTPHLPTRNAYAGGGDIPKPRRSSMMTENSVQEPAGIIEGAGTAKSDSIDMNANPNDFIISADKVNSELGQLVLKALNLDNKKAPKGKGAVPIEVSDGEAIIPNKLVPAAQEIVESMGMTMADLTDAGSNLKSKGKKCGGNIKKGYAGGGPVAFEFEGQTIDIPPVTEIDGYTYDPETEMYSAGGDHAFDKDGNYYYKGNKIDLKSAGNTAQANKMSEYIRNKHAVEKGDLTESKRLKLEKDNQKIFADDKKVTEERAKKLAEKDDMGTDGEAALPPDDNFTLTEKEQEQIRNSKEYKARKAKDQETIDTISAYEDAKDMDEDLPGTTTIDKEVSQESGTTPPKKSGTSAGEIASLAQAGLGMYGLASMDKEEDYTMDRDFVEATGRAQRDAEFGLDPEQEAVLRQDIQDEYARGSSNIQKIAGSAPGVALSNQIQLANQTMKAKARLGAMNAALQLQKQGYSDDMIAKKANMTKDVYMEKERKYERDQMAFADLLNAGIGNIVGAGEYRTQKQFEEDLLDNSRISFNLPT